MEKPVLDYFVADLDSVTIPTFWLPYPYVLSCLTLAENSNGGREKTVVVPCLSVFNIIFMYHWGQLLLEWRFWFSAPNQGCIISGNMHIWLCAENHVILSAPVLPHLTLWTWSV